MSIQEAREAIAFFILFDESGLSKRERLTTTRGSTKSGIGWRREYATPTNWRPAVMTQEPADFYQ